MTTSNHISNGFLFLLIILTFVSCTAREIETDSLYNQLQLNEDRNAAVVLRLTNAIETRGNRPEELVFLNKVTSLIYLKKEIGLTSNQIEKSASYNLLATKTFIDSLEDRFELVYEKEEFIKLLNKTRLRIERINIDNEDEYLHELLQISYCETMLFTFYGEEVGVQEFSWDGGEEQTFLLDSLATGLIFESQANYTKTKQTTLKLRENPAIEYMSASSPTEKEAILGSAQQVFTNYLLNQIVPYWYYTTWEFDGYTAVPKKGGIACGYFVSTTLKHMGMNVNRYKLAQQNPENESRTVAVESINLTKYSFEEPGKDILTDLATYKDGLYFVGLDYHVGYLYIKNQQPYFIHSDYINGYVRIESAKTSQAFESNEYFISPISANKQFIKKWILQEEVVVKRG